MKFPRFILPDQDGKLRTLEDFKDNRYIVIYFYPMDNTPGCTLEAKEFTDLLNDFHQVGVEILGVSTQSSESHARFCDKQELNLTLLSDKDKRLTKELGILGLTGTAQRTTYLMKSDGEIVQEWRSVKPRGHAKEVLDYVNTH